MASNAESLRQSVKLAHRATGHDRLGSAACQGAFVTTTGAMSFGPAVVTYSRSRMSGLRGRGYGSAGSLPASKPGKLTPRRPLRLLPHSPRQARQTAWQAAGPRLLLLPTICGALPIRLPPPVDLTSVRPSPDSGWLLITICQPQTSLAPQGHSAASLPALPRISASPCVAELSREAIADGEERIDELVYELYELGAEERTILEAGEQQ